MKRASKISRRKEQWERKRAHFVKRLSTWLVLSTALTLAAPRAAKATTNIFWDPTGTGGTSGGGNGTWDNSSPFWWNGTSDAAWPGLNSDVAVFGGTAGNVNVNAAVIANGLTFNASGYFLSGSGTIAFGGGSSTITLGSGV